MGEQKPAVYHVVGVSFPQVADRLRPEHDRRLPAERLLAGQLQTALVPVQAHNAPGRTDPASELEGDGPVAAADIEAVHPLPQANPPEQGPGGRPFGAGQEAEPLRTPVAAAQDVATGLISSHRS